MESYYRNDEVLVDSPFSTKYDGIKGHPTNCLDIFLTIHKLGLISIDHRYTYDMWRREKYARKYMTSPLKDWYKVEKTNGITDARRRTKEENKENTGILVRGVRGIS